MCECVTYQGSDVVLPRGGPEAERGRAEGHSGVGGGETGAAEVSGAAAGVSGCSRSLEQLNSIVENIPLDSTVKKSHNAT